MIQITILIPLAISGIAGAVWRGYRQKKLHQAVAVVNHQSDSTAQLALPSPAESIPAKPVFDDCIEMDHYQRVSLYSLALSLPAAWFYLPVLTWICIPLLSYSGYCLCKTVQHSSEKNRRSALTLFEFASLMGSLLTGNLVLASASFTLSFGMRKILLQAGNVAHLGLYEVMNQQSIKIWVLRRDGIEVEATLSDLSEDDRVIVQAGEPIMLEGIVHEGNGVVRQFSLLNTMKSISKQKGDKVFPFTQLESGRLLLRKY